MQYTIKDIRRGRGNRQNVIYASLYNEKNERVIAADIDCIHARLKELLPALDR